MNRQWKIILVLLLVLTVTSCIPQKPAVQPHLQDGQECIDDIECISLYCNPDGKCSDPTCNDGWWNGDETGIDCGGRCQPCDDDSNHYETEFRKSNDDGIVEVSDHAGSPVQLILNDLSNNPVAEAKVDSVSDGDGILILVIPPMDSGYVPTYEYIYSSQLGLLSGKIAKPALLSSITIHIETEEDSPIMTREEIPPGPLEDLWNSPGWEKTVMTTHEWCDRFSTLSKYADIAEASFEVSKAIILSTSLKVLAKKVAGVFLGLSAADVALELCLAATGDEVGLKGLTGVINPGLGYEIVFVEDGLQPVAVGKVVDAETQEPIIDVIVNAEDRQVSTNDQGLFFISSNDPEQLSLLFEADGYEPTSVAALIEEVGLLTAGNVELVKVGSFAHAGLTMREAVQIGQATAKRYFNNGYYLVSISAWGECIINDQLFYGVNSDGYACTWTINVSKPPPEGVFLGDTTHIHVSRSGVIEEEMEGGYLSFHGNTTQMPGDEVMDSMSASQIARDLCPILNSGDQAIRFTLHPPAEGHGWIWDGNAYQKESVRFDAISGAGNRCK